MDEKVYSERFESFSSRYGFPRRQGTCFPSIASLQAELRKQRKHLLGSYISLRALVYDKAGANESKIGELCDVLTQNTLPFWQHPSEKAREFCHCFYDVVIRSLAFGRVGGESVDDIIRLAECMIDSKEVFEVVIKQLLPFERVGDLFRLIEEYEDSFYTPAFTNAVLGAVAVFLGALEYPAPVDSREEENV